MKVFQLDDCDWWVGETLAACIAEAREVCGDGSYCDAEDEGCEVTAEQMQTLKFVDDDLDPPQTFTFAQQLHREIAEGGKFPRFFASTEW
jgi:hypothetical protein